MTAADTYFATCAKGIEALLAEELHALGAGGVRPARAGVAFTGTLEVGYRACLWSRTASRVLMRLATFPAASADELYAGVLAIPWEEHLSAEETIAVDATSTSSAITHTHFAALKAKDAIADRLRERTGERPSVELERPDVRVNVSVRRNVASIALDLSGESLHRRGYREPGLQAAAPLKESLAAAVLLLAGWPEVAAAGGALVDPLCGSGTLPIEAALMAADIAPGLLREHFGFLGWRGHDAALWARLLAEAAERRSAGLAHVPVIAGSDNDPRAVGLARANAERAGLTGRVTLERRELADLQPPAGASGGLVVANPPYGMRLGEVAALGGLYGLLGRMLRERFDGWHAAVLTSEPELSKALGLRSKRWFELYNGTVETRLYTFDVTREWYKAPVTPAPLGRTPGAEALANRLTKNARHLTKWAQRTGVTCWRVYDSDLPEFAVAIDLYADAASGERWAHVAEYAPPPEIEPARAQARLAEVIALVPDVLGVPAERVVLKVRRRQRGETQYERQAAVGRFIEVAEGGVRFLVNLTDYLDTGLFLDHRLTRTLVRDLAAGRRFLNLFAYTGAASVYAAAGGATSTTSVDLSGIYLDWAKRNMALNGYAEGRRHRFVRADVLGWLEHEVTRVADGDSKPYALIFLDPPTFSNSKRMGEKTFDVMRDHVWLLRETAGLLAEGGEIVFSNNARRFRMDAEALTGLAIEDISRKTIPEDFARNPRIHGCWRVRRA